MKKSFLFAVALALLLAGAALAAAPEAELNAELTDFAEDGQGRYFTLVLSARAPTAPYSAVECAVVSSDHENLFVQRTDAPDEAKNLDISFPEGLSGVYHAGRVDGETGEIAYLTGIFAQSGQNELAGETEICRIRFVYTGAAEQTIRFDRFQLVYLDESGRVASAPLESELVLDVSPGLFAPQDEIPLGDAPGKAGVNPLVVIVIALSVLLAGMAAALVIILKKRRTTA